MTIPKVSIFGVPISKLGMSETVQMLADAIESGRPHQIITANPIMVMTALEQPAYMAMMKRAEVIVPDGAGVVWASGYVGNPVKEKVAGIELVHELAKMAERTGWRMYLMGASEEIITAAAEKLKQKYPRLELIGYRDGFFGENQDQDVIRDIREAKPDILLVGRSADKQEPWIDRYKEALNVPLIMGVGGSFDVISGKLKRAPNFWIKLRLEWFYRLMQEPWRYKRMLVLPKFAWKVIREKENVQKD
ncbi:WecB/TagA/CpsF family glycosyltransferase [Paenibacillus sp. MBLB4367]|uniref:WecB/TagA/CpsF family glycosyltransferase n=1 Tax=Paenibacillus sp. MBLB4367 TaxID=3384767 RepID=UPI0039084210